MILDQTTKTIEVVLGEAINVDELTYSVSWADAQYPTTFLANAGSGLTNGTTPQTMVGAPAANVQRAVKEIYIWNADNVGHNVFVQINDNGDVRVLAQAFLEVGETLCFQGESGGWRAITSAGDLKTASVVSDLRNPVSYTGTPTGLSDVFYSGGVFVEGIWAPGIVMLDSTILAPNLISLRYTGVVAINDNYSPTMAGLINFYFSDLNIVNGAFSPEMDALTTIDIALLHSTTGDFSPVMNSLTTLDLIELSNVGQAFAPEMSSLASIDLTTLISTGDFNPDFSSLTTLSLPAFTTTSAFSGNLDALTTLSLPVLTSLASTFNSSINALTALNFPSLVTAGAFLPSATSLTTLTFPVLEFSGSITLSGFDLSDFSLPSIINLQGQLTSTSGNASLTTMSLGAGLLLVDSDVELSACALDQTSVDGLLVSLANLDGTGGTTSYDNHNVTITGTSATPSATGLAAKATLEGRGNVVTVN